ncbi:CinA family protein [Corallococcus aberystwythensis]|uniref:CinA C-terminal domain-containing protein n=1 Tax=Corallococcus aberystwythensis TaxID=2316722 RepID=A0A3A8Q0K1_9BACT|nr:CinA family protein [Corallococcus aberystwythensis]RKH60560.1 hypothetical protein D7W81_25275 [Corallococcus aberystwythensis]
MSDLEALAPKVIARCREAGVRLVLAEACTGGLMTAALTEVPGASAVVERHRFEGERRQVRQAAAARGLALLLEQLRVES